MVCGAATIQIKISINRYHESLGFGLATSMAEKTYKRSYLNNLIKEGVIVALQ